MTYTAIGLHVNIAQRVQLHCEPDSILISEAAYEIIKDSVKCEPIGVVFCKGVQFPIKVYLPQT